MTLGRPRKYHSEEEQRAAHRKRNNAHYARNKKGISEKRRLKREAFNACKPPKLERRRSARVGTPLSLARALFKRCREKVVLLRGKRSLCDILTGVCLEIQKEPSKLSEIVEAHESVIKTSGVVSDLRRCHHEILNLVGCGDELREVQKAIDDIDEILKGLDLILCEAYTDDFMMRFQSGRLEFQLA